MARVFLHAKMRATWQGNSLSAEPENAQDVTRISIRLLIEEIGTKRARRFLQKELERYRTDYKGSGRDDRSPM